MTDVDDDFLRSLARLELALARLVRGDGDGARRAGRRGGRVEFAGHRPYSPGDDVRTIDWSAHARTGRLHVKEFERDEDVAVLLVVDTSASMGLHGKLDAARRLAFAIGWIAIRGGARVRTAAAADGALALGADAHGAGGVAVLRDALARMTAGGATRLASSVARVPRAARGARAVVIVSDLVTPDDARRALAALAEGRDDVVVLHVRAAADAAAAEIDGVVLEDAETGERLVPAPGAAEAARRHAARTGDDWRTFAARHAVRLASFDASAPIDAAAIRSLRAAGVVT